MKVGFLIVGVQRGGTSSLNHYLRQHPQIAMGSTKEVHFFDDEANFATGVPDYDAYHRQFRSKPSALIHGEATPIYFYWADAMRRIWEYNSEMKIIALLRNPVTRAWSQWLMQSASNLDEVPFSSAIRQESERAREALPLQHRVYSYLDRGFYSEQIRRARRFFDDRKLLFVKSEEFFAEPAATLAQVLQFLGVPRATIDVSTVRNRSVADSSMREEDRQFLIRTFRQDVEQVESLLGWDCRDWLS